MRLTEREMDKLYVFMVGEVTRKRREQGRRPLGRALAAGPKLLLLDEPTEGVQPSIVQQIEGALHRVRAELGVSVLRVEQYSDFAWRFAERYLVIAAGDTLGDGRETPERLGVVLPAPGGSISAFANCLRRRCSRMSIVRVCPTSFLENGSSRIETRVGRVSTQRTTLPKPN